MGEADMARIESALGHPLPAEYRDFLARHGAEVDRLREALPRRAVLWTDADVIVRENRKVRAWADQAAAILRNPRRRRPAFMVVGGAGRPWPDNFLVVGTNDSGTYWFVYLDGSEPGVWTWDHVTKAVERDHDSFAGYMADLRRDAERPEEWQ